MLITISSLQQLHSPALAHLTDDDVVVLMHEAVCSPAKPDTGAARVYRYAPHHYAYGGASDLPDLLSTSEYVALSAAHTPWVQW